MEELIREVIDRNRKYSDSDIEFTDYCSERIEQRSINKEEIIQALRDENGLFYVEIQDKVHKGIPEKRYKTVYKISSKYSFIIVILYSERNLKIINVIKTSKQFKIEWRKKISK